MPAAVKACNTAASAVLPRTIVAHLATVPPGPDERVFPLDLSGDAASVRSGGERAVVRRVR